MKINGLHIWDGGVTKDLGRVVLFKGVCVGWRVVYRISQRTVYIQYHQLHQQIILRVNL